MIFLLNLMLFTTGLVLIYNIYRSYSVRNVGTLKTVMQLNKFQKKEASRISQREFTKKLLIILKSLFKSIPLFNVSKNKMNTLEYYAKRLNLTLDDNVLGSDDLFAFRALLQFMYIALFCCLSLFNLKLAVFLVAYRVPGQIFDLVIESLIKDKNKKLLSDFRGFYAEFYYNYTHKSNRGQKIQDVAMRFYNRANSETKFLIDNLRADAILGEEYALEQMKDLFRLVKIHRMADQIKMIITGKTTNTEAMVGFKNEIEAEYRSQCIKDLEAKKFKAQCMQYVAWLILLEIIVLFAFT